MEPGGGWGAGEPPLEGPGRGSAGGPRLASLFLPETLLSTPLRLAMVVSPPAVCAVCVGESGGACGRVRGCTRVCVCESIV